MIMTVEDRAKRFLMTRAPVSLNDLDALTQEIREAVEAAVAQERESGARVAGALRDLLRDVDARSLLDSGFKGMGHNIAVESAGKLRVDAEYARRILRDLSGEVEK